MGLPIYMNYYTIHDDTNNRIGFVPHKTSDKGRLVDGEQPERIFRSLNPDDYDSALSWAISYLLVFIFLCIWLCLIAETMANHPSGVQPGLLFCGAMGFTTVFGIVVFLYLQPILDQFIK